MSLSEADFWPGPVCDLKYSSHFVNTFVTLFLVWFVFHKMIANFDLPPTTRGFMMLLTVVGAALLNFALSVYFPFSWIRRDKLVMG